MRKFYEAPLKYECAIIVDHGLPALAHAVSIDKHLNEFDELGRDFEGTRLWDASMNDVDKSSIVEQTLKQVQESADHAGCEVEIEITDTYVRAQCNFYKCTIGDIAASGARVSLYDKAIDVTE